MNLCNCTLMCYSGQRYGGSCNDYSNDDNNNYNKDICDHDDSCHPWNDTPTLQQCCDAHYHCQYDTDHQ